MQTKTKGLIVLPIAVIVLLVVAISVAVGMYNSQPKYDKSITNIERTAQQVGGANVTAYVPVIAENIDWEAISDGEREGISRYAIDRASEQAQSSGASNYSVIGVTANDRQTAFMFTGGDTLTVFAGGEPKKVDLNV